MTDRFRVCPEKRTKTGVARGIKRMARLPRGRLPQHQRMRRVGNGASALRPQTLNVSKNQLSPVPSRSIRPPSTPEIDPRGPGPVVEPAVQDRVVQPSDGVLDPEQRRRRRRHPGEQIQHQQLPISPMPGEADQTAQGRVIVLAICSRGIQTHEKQTPFARTQAAPQPPAVAAIAAEGRFRRRAVGDRAQGCVRSRDHRRRG